MSGAGEGALNRASPDIEDVIAQAKDQVYGNVKVVRSNEVTLLLDLDSDEAVRQFDEVLPVVEAMYGPLKVEKWVSSGGNDHVRITLARPASVKTRLALQAMLGSDGIKEALSLKRVSEGQKEPSILFRPVKKVPRRSRTPDTTVYGPTL
jgi:hypothetical protein